MDHGRILALDTPEGLKRSVAAGAEVTVRAEGELGALATRLGEMEGATDIRVLDDTIRVQLDDRDGALAKVVATARDANYTLTDLSVTEPTLETVFISLTGKDLRE
jgi:ABC-2 type transport system ATP-binding protein